MCVNESMCVRTIYERMYVCMYVNMYVCVCMHVCMYACMYACMYVYSQYKSISVSRTDKPLQKSKQLVIV